MEAGEQFDPFVYVVSKAPAHPRRGLPSFQFPLRGVVQQPDTNPAPGSGGVDRLDDEDFPAYSMGRAAEILGVTQAFLRSLDNARLLTPQRSEGGHRRYSRYQLRIAARVRELVDAGNSLDGACRIVILEDQLAEAQALNATLQDALDAHESPDRPH